MHVSPFIGELSVFQIFNELLGETSISPVLEGNPSSLQDFLVSLGLPMYLGLLAKHYGNMKELQKVTEGSLRGCGITDPNHCKTLQFAIQALKAQGEGGPSPPRCTTHHGPKPHRGGSKLANVKDKV